jgi:sn-glycerol 3-phosphate transport system permease protein
MAAGPALDFATGLCVLGGFSPRGICRQFRSAGALTLDNFREALSQAPFPRYALNTFILVTMILAAQLVLCTLAAYAFARYRFRGHQIAFALVLVQLMITPEILIVENYVTLARFNLVDTILGIGLPYMASAFGIFLLRQAFKSTPKELEEAARLEGCGTFGRVVAGVRAPWRVPLTWPTAWYPSATTGTIFSGPSS